VERKEIRIPFAANFLDNSRNGIIYMAKCHPWEHHNMELFGSHEEEKRAGEKENIRLAS
jgi:hypothetical protein